MNKIMDADIKGMYNWYIKGRRACNILQAEDNTRLGSKLAKAYIKYCYEKGYAYLSECPDVREVMNELQKFK